MDTTADNGAEWAVFAPATIPYDNLGPLGTFTKYLVENHNTALKIGYLISWLIHIGEALYSYKLCKKKGITNRLTQLLWFLQTLAFGGFSLYYLQIYKPSRKANEGFNQKTK
ncbi:hypothetical protein JD844_031682 [Phrynosoma platyrhinos]|uniref:Transmembrane protein 254 n=1 Tax=Phrynosoma platyrhinos TaxID=52577 RepID=A0ABQ7T4D1_PHRPL|nr:hypothetical protein JD844_031682 [Phrynosoma platyrhinos]